MVMPLQRGVSCHAGCVLWVGEELPSGGRGRFPRVVSLELGLSTGGWLHTSSVLLQ